MPSYYWMSGTYSGSKSHIAPKLAIYCVFDWLLLIAVIVVATILGRLDANRRLFHLTDPSISFPLTEPETVSLTLLLVLCAAVPIVAIPTVVLVLVPGRAATRNMTRRQIWMQELWEIHIGWLGLAVSLVATWLFTHSMRNMFGKPRPDLLARCDPDLGKYIARGYDNGSASGQLLTAKICHQVLCHSSDSTTGRSRGTPETTAASPAYPLVLALVPFGLTVVVNPSQWFDFRYRGFDIVFGFSMGSAT